MAKKRKPDRDRPKKAEPSRNVHDRRAMEGVVQKLFAGLQGQADQNRPLGKAQALMYQAFDEPDEQRRVQIAKDALAISADCADAYVLLAEHAHSRKEARHLYAQGVAAGERALGEDAFQQNVGHFWGLLETRPYMRARLGLACAIWSAGHREEAVQHLEEMLRLNPGDNQGVRYTLAECLLFLDRDDDVARLLQQYDENLAAWAYTKALLAFRQNGDTPEGRRLLANARKTNPHVPAYLSGDAFPPNTQRDFFSPGDENEALNYVRGCLTAWKATAGAIAWLRANDGKKKRIERQIRQPKGPLGFIKTWLNRNLGQEYDVWQADFRQMPNWIKTAGEIVRPWNVFVASRSNDLILGHEMSGEVPSPSLLWDALAQAMQHPAAGKPHRPSELQVRADERWESLRQHFDEIGIALAVTDDMQSIDAIFDEMFERVCGKPRPGLLDMPGVTPAQAGSYYEAAAFFFRQAPWKKVGDEAAIKVECDKFHSGPWYAVLMGQSGLTTGLALYEDLAVLRQLWAGVEGDEERARKSVATSVIFGEKWSMATADLDAATNHGWQVARSDAYPDIFHKEHGLSLRQPLAWELELVDGCLRAIPEFVNRHTQDDDVSEVITVPVALGQLKLTLSWVAET